MNRKTFLHCLKVTHTYSRIHAFRCIWAGMDLAKKYEVVNMEETMGKVKEMTLGPDGLPLENGFEQEMTQEEVDQALKEIFKEEEKLKKNFLKLEKRSSFIKGFFFGWLFFVVINIIDFLI